MRTGQHAGIHSGRICVRRNTVELLISIEALHEIQHENDKLAS